MVTNSDEILIKHESVSSEISLRLIDALSEDLSRRYDDDDGAGDFKPGDIAVPGAAFFVAWRNSQAVGCGAIRPLSTVVGEIKRMYVDPIARGLGIGRKILTTIELFAQDYGYQSLKLETGLKQPEAIRLYESAGYTRIEPYGHFKDHPLSVCFEKRFSTPMNPPVELDLPDRKLS